MIRSLLTVVLLGLAAPVAQAAFNPILVDTTSVSGGTSFNYTLNFSTTGGGFTPRLDTNSRLTIYDIPGFVSATAGAGFTVSSQNLGINAPNTTPSDDSTLKNVSFTYTGPSVSVDTLFTGFSIVSTYSSLGTDNYTSKFWNVSSYSTAGEIGFVTVPSSVQTVQNFSVTATVPDSGITAVLLSAGLICLFGLRRRLG